MLPEKITNFLRQVGRTCCLPVLLGCIGPESPVPLTIIASDSPPNAQTQTPGDASYVTMQLLNINGTVLYALSSKNRAVISNYSDCLFQLESLLRVKMGGEPDRLPFK